MNMYGKSWWTWGIHPTEHINKIWTCMVKVDEHEEYILQNISINYEDVGMHPTEHINKLWRCMVKVDEHEEYILHKISINYEHVW